MPVTRQNRFLLLYGSQTGQAKAIAEEIAERAEENDLHADIYCLSMTEKKFFIEREKCVVIVTSTTGDGEPPDTALKFVRRLKKKTLPGNYLSHLHYALLGLGDSNYTNFCNCAKSLDKRLQDLGARHFYDCGWADDAVGLEVAVEPWIDGLWAAVKKQLFGSASDAVISDHTREITKSKIIEPEFSAHVKTNDSQALQNGVYPNLSINSAIAVDNTTNNNVDNSEGKQTNSVPGISVDELTSSKSENISEKCDRTKGDDKSEKMKESDVFLTEKLSHLVITNQSNSIESLAASKNGLSDTRSTVQLDVNQSCLPEHSNTVKLPKENDVISRESRKQIASDVSLSVISPVISSIQHSVPPLSECNLSVPVLSPAYLSIKYDSSLQLTLSELPVQNDCSFPSSASSVSMATMMSAITLTTENAVKKAMMVQLDISECNIQYQPGDSFSLVCPNNSEEVDSLLQRLGVESIADEGYQLAVLADTKKKNAAVPKHIPEKGTLRHIFTTCLDIREPPKKALLRVLVEYTSDPGEKRRLQELCSRQGNDDFAKFIREPSLSVLDIFNHFSSCLPPVERLIEHLPRLQPRPYSICSSPGINPGSIDFVFNVVDIDATDGRTYRRKGVCTGWLEKLEVVTSTVKGDPEAKKQLENHSITTNIQVPVFARTNQHFHLPSDVTTPVIMIGPGTGVAPFLGFLKHRAAMREADQSQHFGEMWLFHGCRHKNRDYLFRDEFDKHLKSGNLTKLFVCFSRDEQPEDSPRYVQDNIRVHGAELVELIDNSGAVVYVCGDARNMAKDVNQAFVDTFSAFKGISEEDAKKYLMQLRLQKHYLEDVWT